MNIKQKFIDNAEWLLLIVGIIGLIVSIGEFFAYNPEEFESLSAMITSLGFGFWVWCMLFFVLRIFKYGEQRITDR
jgi:uncharacterized membrane-anchored protein